MAITINSDTHIPIDESFKVSAGPGAGKTHWLSLHIRNIIANSKKLGVTRKVACISYTNVGADTIMERLPKSTSIVEVSTIHSFLYTHIVKPFLRFDIDEFEINPDYRVVPGEPLLTKAFAILALNEMNYPWLSLDSMLEGLRKCHWVYKNGVYTKFKPSYPIKAKNKYGVETKYPVPQGVYDGYISYCWRRGYLSYEDIVYLAIQLLNKHPQIYDYIIARFPYFFVDEFQDSLPPIIDFITELGKRGVVVGVVGDKAQTIYDFIGASVAAFDNFTVPELHEYEIHGNRRSSPEIINLLNIVRPDFLQYPINVDSGPKPVVIIGDRLDAYQKSVELCGSQDVRTLAYPNIIANAMKYGAKSDIPTKKLIDSDFDLNFVRGAHVKTLLKATEYAYHNELHEAWHQLDLLDSDRSKTILVLRNLLNNREKFLNGSLYDFFLFIKDSIMQELPDIRKKDVRNFYTNNSYRKLAMSMAVADSKASHKTIHKAKGEEFDNVMLILDNEDDLSVLTSPALYDKTVGNAHRVYYVALSRAKRNLFINVVGVSNLTLLELKKLPVDVCIL